MLVYLEPAECGAMAALLTAVRGRLREAADKSGIPAWAPIVTAAAPAAADFVRRRLGAALRCARAAAAWDQGRGFRSSCSQLNLCRFMCNL